MNKSSLVTELNEAHRHMLVLVQDYGQADFERPGAAGVWSAKDVFAHLAFWNWEASRAIEMALRGEPPAPYLVSDAELEQINEREHAARVAIPLPKVMDDYRRSHRSLLALVERTPESALAKSVDHRSAGGRPANAAWVAETVVEHYREHAQRLAQFRNRE